MRIPLGKNWLILSGALAVGGLAAFGTQRYIREQVDAIEARERDRETVSLVVAKNDLPKGAVLNTDTLAVRDVPAEWAHSNALTPEQFDRIEGNTLAFPVRKGEPVLWAQLVGQKAPTFSARLAAGRRAVTVAVDEISSLSGMVEPGDLIDLVVSTRGGVRNRTYTLLQSVPVLAVGARVTPGGEGAGVERSFTTLTLDTTPQEARQIIAARETGQLTALLRSPMDATKLPGDGTQTAQVETARVRGRGGLEISDVPVIYGGSPIHEPVETPLPDAVRAEGRPFAPSRGDGGQP